MKFSERWLREWINPPIDSINLKNQMIMAGFEVDSIDPVSAKFSRGVVIGQIVTIKYFTNDSNDRFSKFRIAKVDIGKKQLLNIVSCAQNCRPTIRVAVATIGTVLPGKSIINILKIKNEVSEGILCSFSKLGIPEKDENSSNLIEFPLDAPIGQDILDYFKFEDNIINISVTPNRSDCLSLLGIARDLSVLNKISINNHKISPIIPVINNTISIHIDVPKACPRYLYRIIKNVDNKIITPVWMKEKLRRCGIIPINVIVDISNYVLIELGQPIHLFDIKQIKGDIDIRLASKFEKFTSRENRIMTLLEDTLVIADQEKVLEIAGILSGKNACITLETSEIVVGCGFFNPIFITGRARYYYGLHTESSYRYEHGVDPELSHISLEYITKLFITICGGNPGPVINITNIEELPKLKIIKLRKSKLNKLIGYYIEDHLVNEILINLGCKVTKNDEGWNVLTPSWRFDINIEEDLIKELVRIYGYNNIPNIPIYAKLEIKVHRESELSLLRVKTLLVDLGYQEIITYSFVDPKMQNLLHPKKSYISIIRPISIEMSSMRLSLLTGLLETVLYNQNRQHKKIRLFETGFCFIPDKSKYLGIRQDIMLSGVITGPRFDDHWNLSNRIVDFYDLKGDIESIFDLTGKLDNIEFRVDTNPALHPGQSSSIYLNEEFIGFIGVIHPKLEKKLKLNCKTLVFELIWEKISECLIPKFSNFSKFPFNSRDISIVVEEKISAIDVLNECKKIINKQLVKVILFDVYKDRQIMSGYKSLSIRLILQDSNRTLTEKEINDTVTQCVDRLNYRFKAYLR